MLRIYLGAGVECIGLDLCFGDANVVTVQSRHGGWSLKVKVMVRVRGSERDASMV